MDFQLHKPGCDQDTVGCEKGDGRRNSNQKQTVNKALTLPWAPLHENDVSKEAGVTAIYLWGGGCSRLQLYSVLSLDQGPQGAYKEYQKIY